MEEYNFQLENDLKENQNALTKKPIIKHNDEFLSPKKSTPLMKFNENFLTPSRGSGFMKGHTPGTPFIQTPTQDPMMETPNGSKIFHPFLSSIIRNLDKPMISPGLFSTKERSIKDDSILSPDLAGELFPVEIDVDVESQYQFEAALFKKYEKYCNKKSDIFFKKGTIAPSPDNCDSGIGVSLQTSHPSLIDSDRSSLGPMSLLHHKTPPSKYKWNRDEYRDYRSPSPSMDFCYESDDGDESMEFSPDRDNLESTKIFDDAMGLECNVSMRNHSVIVSLGLGDEGDSMGIGEDMCLGMLGVGESFEGLRSSPSCRFSGSVLDDLAMSPICGGLSEDRNTRGRGGFDDNGGRGDL